MASALLAKIKGIPQQNGSLGRSEEAIKTDMLHTKTSFAKWMPLERCQKRYLHLYPTNIECFGESNGQKYAKGLYPLKDVKAVEVANDDVLDMPFTFQIVYEKDEDHNALYFACHFRQQQEEWIKEVRKAAKSQKAEFWSKYHSGAWKKDKWSCCMKVSKDAEGCKDATNVSSNPLRIPRKIIPVPGAKRPKQPREERLPEINDKTVTLRGKKFVVAISGYSKKEDGDLELKMGEKYEVLDDSHDMWWRLKSTSTGDIGSAPRNCLGEDLSQSIPQPKPKPLPKPPPKAAPKPAPRIPHPTEVLNPDSNQRSNSKEDLTSFDWYFGKPPRDMVDPLLKSTRTDGCFLVRDSTTSGGFVLSVYSSQSQGVKHFKVKKDQNKKYHFNDYYKFDTIPELIAHHKKKCSGLPAVLTSVPLEKGFIQGSWIIDEDDLEKENRIGKGYFSTVYKGRLKRGLSSKTVAVKSMELGEERAVSIVKEISTISKLSHPNLVGFHGITFEKDHINIVTEFMSEGNLKHYIERQQGVLRNNLGTLLKMLRQVNLAMCYLESQNIIHRDLAARNCLVGPKETIKVCDFGLSRLVDEGIYQAQDSSAMPLKWCSPEVLESNVFSTKSDVWAFGILMWEVFSFGASPYSHLSNVELLNAIVRNGYRLKQPERCPNNVYQVMQDCWQEYPSDRPSFFELQDLLDKIHL